MFRNKIVVAFIFSGVFAFAQNDQDALRYSRPGVGGTSRFLSMGGAFGAIGADMSCASYNPAGLGVYRKGDISFSGGLRFTDNRASIYNKTNSALDANFVFNNFGIVVGWKSASDPESRHVLGFTNTQLQNFNNSVRMSGYTNSSSIAKDMLNLASKQPSIYSLNSSYENLGFNTFLLDTADTGNAFFSSLDTKRSVKQTRDIVTSGRVNDINFSYAYSYKDQFYFGASIGIPQINYASTTTHTEADDKDSMRVAFTSPTSYTSTYIADLPYAYTDKLGFNNLTYTEYFKTSGSGFNLKLGGIARLSDAFRLGFYVHTPTFYRLTDDYYNSLSVAFDKTPGTPITDKYPKDGGYYTYRLRTPSRFGLNAAYIIGKLAVIGIDYEMINYKNAQFSSSQGISDFSNVNATITEKYSVAHTVKVGAELNVKPLMLRAGYIMQGSPFGDVFTGDFVKHTISAGVGFRTKNNFYVDFVVYRTFTKENYYLFTTLNTNSQINYNATMVAATAGFKF